METRTLVLTRSYIPHQIIGWFEAIGMIFTNKVNVVEVYTGADDILGVIPAERVRDYVQVAKAYPGYRVGTNLVVRTPSVIQIRHWEGSVKRNIKYSRENVITRDKHQCQYCGTKHYNHKELNRDHVIPRKQGGKTTWENTVASCIICNSKKADRTPEQAGMKLLRRPFKPKYLPNSLTWLDNERIHESWKPYLQMMAETA